MQFKKFTDPEISTIFQNYKPTNKLELKVKLKF